MNIYYLSIQTTALVDYFAKALILPTRFYKNRPLDIQSRKDDYIVLSKNKFLNESNCSIELILTDDEVSSFLKKEESIFLYEKPIPISRIQKIYFKDEKQKVTTIFNIEKTKTAFISKSLIEIIEEENKKIKSVDNNYNYSLELEKKIKTYNQVLGGIAFVRYTLEGKYSTNYFSILSYFNNHITKRYIEKEKVITGYNGAFSYKGEVWNELSPLIYKNISADDVKECAKSEKIVIDNSLGLFNFRVLENTKSITYKLAILATYGEGSNKRKSINDLISDYKNKEIPETKIEGISLIFGINNGYSSFRNQYDKKIVKFKMDSLLDYYTIESVFQYVINEERNNQQFEYIETIFSNEKLVLNISKDNIEAKEKKELIWNQSNIENLKKEFEEFKLIINKKMIQKDKEILELQNEIQKLKSDSENLNHKFDKEKEKIYIEKDLERLYLKDLKVMAKEHNIKGRSKMNKATLLKAIKENQ